MNEKKLLASLLRCKEEDLVFFEQCKCDPVEIVTNLKKKQSSIRFEDVKLEVSQKLRQAVQGVIKQKKSELSAELKSARMSGEEKKAANLSIELHLLDGLLPSRDINVGKDSNSFFMDVGAPNGSYTMVVADIFQLYLEDELKNISEVYGLPIRYIWANECSSDYREYRLE